MNRGRVKVNLDMSRRTLVAVRSEAQCCLPADRPAPLILKELAEVDADRQFESLLRKCENNEPLGNFESAEIILESQNGNSRYLLVRVPIAQTDQLQLSPREREIVRMIAKGHPNKVIARVLDISVWTVGTYIRRVFMKLGVASRASMIARLHEQGFF